MRKSFGTILATFLVLLFGIVFVLLWTGSRNPAVTVSFIAMTNNSGHWLARFAVTNVGRATAVGPPIGSIEINGQSGHLPVGCGAGKARLAAGEADEIQIFLPRRLDSEWRFTCHYARTGLRTSIYDWQWGENGPGAKANWMVPQILKGKRFDVTGTSDWIRE
jgi:hypothetical protein